MDALEVLRRLAGSFWVRALISVGLLALVATQIDFGAIRSRLSAGSWWLFVLAALILFASFVVGGLRWHIFLRAAGIDSTQRRAVDAYLLGTFTTNFLPTQIGGDVTRALYVAERGRWARAATTVVVDRASALACMIVVGWFLIVLDPRPVTGQLYAALGSATAAFVIMVALLLLLPRIRAVRRLLPDRARPVAGEIRAALAGCLNASVLGRTFLIGLGFQALVYLGAWLVARSISLELPAAVLGASLAPVLILAAAPVSIGGYGVREGSFVLLLGYTGITATDATLFSLLQGASFALASLPGALVLLRRGSRPAAVSAGPAEPENR